MTHSNQRESLVPAVYFHSLSSYNKNIGYRTYSSNSTQGNLEPSRFKPAGRYEMGGGKNQGTEEGQILPITFEEGIFQTCTRKRICELTSIYL